MQMLSLAEVAERLGVGPTGVRGLVASGAVLALPGPGGQAVLPAEQFDGAQPVKHLSGVLTLLRDARYTDEEALRWLTTADETLPGTPLQALHENRATEVKRRAQALAF